jgi:uncharacterized membrane protein YsdA (DUF1294 family)
MRWFYVLYFAMSVFTFVMYARDKAAARTDRRRTPESALLVLGLIGGWPGAIAAQQFLRHKTRKRSFQLAFWATVLVNVAGLVVLSAFVSQMEN